MSTFAPPIPGAKIGLGLGLAGAVFAVIVLGILAAIVGNVGCPTGVGPDATRKAKTDIPADYLRPSRRPDASSTSAGPSLTVGQRPWLHS